MKFFLNHLDMARCPLCHVRTVYNDICFICRRKETMFEACKEDEWTKKFRNDSTS